MASADLKQLDKDLWAEIKQTVKGGKTGAQLFREEFSDIQAHEVHIYKRQIIEQVLLEMALREGYSNDKEFQKANPIGFNLLKKEIKTPVDSFLKGYYALLVKKQKQKNSPYKVIVSPGSSPIGFSFSVFQAVEDGTANIFKNFIKGIKTEPQRPLIWAINVWAETNSRRGEPGGVELGPKESKYIRSQGRTMGKNAEGEVREWEQTNTNDSLADFGHIGDSAVGTQRRLKAQDILHGKIFNFESSPETQRAAAKVLDALAKQFGFKYTSKSNFAGEMEKILQVELESSRLNKATMTKGEVTNLENIINEALGKVQNKKGGWELQEGSDSFIDMATKKVLNAWAEPLNKNKKVKILTKVDYKRRKNEKSTVLGKTKRRKIKKVSNLPLYKKPKQNKPSEKRRADLGTSSPAMEPLSMIGLINKELPAIVESNMGRPRLESQTGRLAGSARVTDIITTPQGFPSIGYTYQLNPYQTFETGGKQGSTDYDPRRLIDQSLRQIAIKFAMGRFYTRREQ